MGVVPLNGWTCEQARKHLDAFASNELSVEIRKQLANHMANCSACSALLQNRLSLKGLVKHAVDSQTAPGDLRDRIRAAVRKEPIKSTISAGWPRWVMAAAALLVVSLSAAGMLEFWQHGRLTSGLAPTAQQLGLSEQVAAVLKVGVGDHIHCVIESRLGEAQFTREQMAQKMGPQYAALVPLIEKDLPQGFFISVGHRCTVNGRQFVHLVLKQSEKLVSVVITEKKGLSFPADAVASPSSASGFALHQARLQSLEAAGFQTKEHLAFFVSSLDRSENLEIAAGLSASVGAFLEQL